jgi:hypothetical protein
MHPEIKHGPILDRVLADRHLGLAVAVGRAAALAGSLVRAMQPFPVSAEEGQAALDQRAAFVKRIGHGSILRAGEAPRRPRRTTGRRGRHEPGWTP